MTLEYISLRGFYFDDSHSDVSPEYFLLEFIKGLVTPDVDYHLIVNELKRLHSIKRKNFKVGEKDEIKRVLDVGQTILKTKQQQSWSQWVIK